MTYNGWYAIKPNQRKTNTFTFRTHFMYSLSVYLPINLERERDEQTTIDR